MSGAHNRKGKKKKNNNYNNNKSRRNSNKGSKRNENSDTRRENEIGATAHAQFEDERTERPEFDTINNETRSDIPEANININSNIESAKQSENIVNSVRNDQNDETDSGIQSNATSSCETPSTDSDLSPVQNRSFSSNENLPNRSEENSPPPTTQPQENYSPPAPQPQENSSPSQENNLLQPVERKRIEKPKKIIIEKPIKHPLICSFTFWYFKQEPNKAWEDCHHEILSFDTVEDFWCIYSHLQTTNFLNPNTGYSLFKTGIKPMWEDKKNVNGGRWMLTFKQNSHQMWLHLILHLIGDKYSQNIICGVAINKKRGGDKIAVWTETTNKAENMAIGKETKETLEYFGLITFQIHRDENNTRGSRAKYAFEV